jgi:AAA15 family ATPase/GTPase
MLKSFSVTGFKGFRDTCTIDFSKVRDYDFNQNLIKNGLVNKVLLYGKNGSGKSNLGLWIINQRR